MAFTRPKISSKWIFDLVSNILGHKFGEIQHLIDKCLQSSFERRPSVRSEKRMIYKRNALNSMSHICHKIILYGTLYSLHSSLVCKQFGHIILVWYPCGMISKHSWPTLIIFNPTIDILFFLHSYSLIWESIQLGKFIQLRLGHMIILYPFDF